MKKKRQLSIMQIVIIIAMVFIPFIVIQWKLKYVWMRLESYSALYYLYLAALLYVVAYIMIFQNKKVGYFLMWLIFVILQGGYLIFYPYYLSTIWSSLDLWVNIIISIAGFYFINKEE